MYVRLGEICDFQSGGTPSKNNQKFFDGDIPWITTVALKGLGIDGSDAVNWITEEAIKQSAAKIVPANSIMIGTRVGVGKVAINLVDMSTSQDIVSLIGIDETRWCKEYLCKCLIGKSQYLNSQARGATIKGIKIDTLANLKIPEISIEKQYEVSRIIDKTRIIIEQRKQELMNLNELMKARFVEMFGNIKTNEYGWEKCTFKDISTKITDGEHGTVPRVDEGEGYLYFMARNITKEGEIDLSETSFVPREIHEKIYKRCNPEKDDLLLVCVGATIGKCTLVSEIMGEFSMARSVALIKPNKEMVTSNFLINLLRSEAIQNDIDHCSHAAAQAGLYTNMINSLEAFVPPMDLQIEFDTFCEQVYKSKVAVQKALDETQLLFDSLMQEYFG